MIQYVRMTCFLTYQAGGKNFKAHGRKEVGIKALGENKIQ